MEIHFGDYGDPPPPDENGSATAPGSAQAHAVLPYRVEVWDETGGFVEQVVAFTSTSSVGWAAYFAAKQAFPTRTITFRDQTGVLSRWDAKKH